MAFFCLQTQQNKPFCTLFAPKCNKTNGFSLSWLGWAGLAQPSQAKHSQAKPSQAKPSQAKPSKAKQSQAKPSKAKQCKLGNANEAMQTKQGKLSNAN